MIRGEVGRFDHLTLQLFDLTTHNTTIGKKYFSTGTAKTFEMLIPSDKSSNFDTTTFCY